MTDAYFGQPGDSGWDGTGTAPKAAAGPHKHPLPLPTASITSFDPAVSGLDANTVQAAIDRLAAGGGSLTNLSPSGSPSVIADTGTPAFLHFPGATKMADGRLLVVYRQGTDHATTTDGKIVAKIGTVGNDYSVTWGTQFDIYDDPSLDCRDPEVATLSDGTLIVSFFTWNGSTTYNIQTTRSTDDGATWETPVSVPTSFTAEACSAKVVELPSGDLLLPIYGNNGGNHTAATVKSTDGGATWGSQTTIVSGTVGSGDNWTEPYIVLLADGRLHCLIREDTDGYVYRTTSDDGGATWATAAVAFEGDARPAHVQVQSGGLLHVSRAAPNGDTIYRTSTDHGVTWSGEAILDASGTRNEYASIVQLDFYRYAVAYGIENSTTDADIKFELFTDAANLDSIAGLTGGDPTVALDDLTDVTITSPSMGQVLRYDGSAWVNDADSGHIHIVTEQGADGDGAAIVWYLANYADAETLAVYVNGARVTNYTHAGDTVTFAAAPTLGHAVVFDYIAEEA